MTAPLPVYAVNLPSRPERRESLCAQFAGRDEFDLHIVPGIERRNGAVGLWQTFYGIVESEAAKGTDYFIFCEDDHVFTEAYSPELLLRRIAEAETLEADLLSGGMSVARTPVEVSPGLFWVSWFNGMQFTVVFRRCYRKILAARTSRGYAADIQLSYLADRKYVMWPYISTQREFGYSDATVINDEEGRVTRFFNKTQTLLSRLHSVRRHYSAISPETVGAIMRADVSGMYIPAHVINLPERTDRLAHIRRQIEGRSGFDLRIVEASRHEIGAVGLWQSICGIVRQAKDSGEEFVLICEDDHFFTRHYSRDTFFRQIMLAGAMGMQMLSGGVGDFGNLVPLPGGIAWIDRLWCTQFMVIYRRAFDIILDAPFRPADVADDKLSALLTAKAVTVPFISEQTDFGYSDITESNNRGGMIRRHFDRARRQLRHYDMAFRQPADMPRPVAVGEYLAAPGVKALHLGCGFNRLPGWLDTDIAPDYGVTFLDVTQPFPVPDNSFDLIFAEHLAEALAPEALGEMLRECHRILRPGGTLRLTFFCADALRTMTSSRRINEFIHRFDDAYLHLTSEVCDSMTLAGFDTPAAMAHTVSSRPELADVNRFESYSTPDRYRAETATLEARKPR